MADINSVIAALNARPDLASDSDADAAAALNAAILTPRPGVRITLAYLADSSVWGFAKAAAAQAALQAAAAAGGSNGAQAAAVLAMLGGSGFNPADPQIATLLPGIVALCGGAITTQDATNAMFTTSYAAGTPDVQTADVTLARKAIVFEAAKAVAIGTTLPTGTQAVIAQLDELHRELLAGQAVTFPTATQMAQLFASAIGG